MEREIEIKFKVNEKILSSLKNIKLEPYEEIDEYFTTKEMLDDSTFLRLRRKKGKIVLQLKDIVIGGEQAKDCYEADEIHIELTNEQYEKMKKIFSATFPYNFVIKKIRNKGNLNDCEICLDEVEEIGMFLEIEGPKEKILEVCKKFNLDPKNKENGRGYAIMMAKKVGIV